MLRDILESFNIEYFGAVDFSLCRPANMRLYGMIPPDSVAVFMLFPYYMKDTAPLLAKFAAVPDYHIFADGVFKACEKYLIEKYPGRFFKGFADHSPVAECDGACRAGLGIMGRHSMLINEKYSSFVCIGELICTLSEKEISREGIPFGDGLLHYCEDCGNCAPSCPGMCCGDTVRDTCLSHITQKKQSLSANETFLVQQNGYAWGCDRCALACPHSACVQETPIDYFRRGAIIGNAREIISGMDADTFEKYPFSWRQKEVIMRNFDITESENG